MTVYCLYWHACVQVCFLNCCVVCVLLYAHCVYIHVHVYVMYVCIHVLSLLMIRQPSCHSTPKPRANSTITCSYVLSQACVECVYSLGFCS